MSAIGKKKDPPKLHPDLGFVWTGFVALSEARSQGQPIQFSEIEAWLNLNGIKNATRRQEVTHYIRIMDAALLKHHKEHKNS